MSTDVTTHTSTDTVSEPAPAVAPAATPVKTYRGRRFLRGLRTATIVLLLVGGAAAGGTYIVKQRQAAAAYVDLGSAVLTAAPVTVGTADAGTVTQLMVAPQAHVNQGQDLATVTMTNGTRTETKILRAPTTGTVTYVNVTVGGVAQPGQPIVTMYDASKLTFQAQVPNEQLKKLRLGMTAYITGPGLNHRVAARLDRVVPRVTTDPAAATDRLTVVLTPEAAETGTVSTLVPGLQFSATVDTGSAAGTTPAVNSA
jgi:multidrug resistance efflux pump